MLNKRGTEKSDVSCDEFRSQVQKKAYELWQKRGCSHGNDWSDWLAAEKIVKSSKD